MASGDYAKADELFQSAIASGTVNADVLGEIYCQQALCKLKLGRMDEAAKCLDDADRASADGLPYWTARKELAVKQGNKAKAEECQRKIDEVSKRRIPVKSNNDRRRR